MMDLKLKELGGLNGEIKRCIKCKLSRTRENAICGEGNQSAKLMLIAQAPGKNEDKEGKMFIGPSGEVLDDLLGKAGIDKKEIYMTNLIKCTLPKCRKPKQDEIKTCSPYLHREIALICPTIIAPLGYYATRYAFEKYGISAPKSKSEFTKVYGTLFLSEDKKIFPLPHPAALLYNDSHKKEMVNDYRKLKVLLSNCK